MTDVFRKMAQAETYRGRYRSPAWKLDPEPPVPMLPGAKFLVDPNELLPQHRGYNLLPRREIALGVGDYSIELPDGRSLESHVVVERKSLKNIVGDASQGRKAWEDALRRLCTVERPHLLIETDFRELLAGKWRFSKTAPQAVVGSLVAWCNRYRVPCWFVGDRVHGELLTKWLLQRAAQDFFKG